MIMSGGGAVTDSDELTNATKREGPSGSERPSRSAKPETVRGELLSRGALVGRYVLLDKLGEGGMGVVYSAFDPELDRRVAIKVLQGEEAEGSGGGHDQAWLLREAQALARLQHPNVVAVHDVGSLPGDRVFIAMEHVDGMTMRQWLKAERRSWRDIVPLMCAAGEGLAAAHRAGLVHRDFKPENVLVGRDGRVYVMDFGLARLRIEDVDAAAATTADSDVETGRSQRTPASGVSPLSANLTLAGHIVGTPAYMAPEIYDGKPGDARGDQFAFGVTLFESLYGARPFDKKELSASRSSPPKPKIPTDAHVPARLQRVVLRALAVDPAQRFGSMDELIAELARDPFARRRRVLFAAAGAVVVAGAVVATMSLAGNRSRPCQGISERLAGVWDPNMKRVVREAFGATKLAFAPQAYADLERALDSYTKEWVTTAEQSCEATRVRGDQTEEVLTLRQICLDQRLDGIGALVHVLQEPTKPLVEKGGKAVGGLDPIAACSNVAALRTEGAPPPEKMPKVKELQHKLAETNAQSIAGNFIAAGATAMGASRLADELDYMPAKAQADIMRGLIMMGAQNLDEARQLIRDGALAAIEGKRDDLAAYAAYTLAGIEAQGSAKYDDAKLWLAIGRASQKRYGGTVPNLDMVAAQITGVIDGLTGDTAGALAAHQKGFEIAQRVYTPENPVMWETEEDLAASLSGVREDEQAARHFEHAIALRAAVVGQDHADIGLMSSNLGANYTHIKDPRAKATLERAVAIREKTYGKNTPLLVPTLQNVSEWYRWQGDFATSMTVDERAMKIAAGLPGKEHPIYQDVATDYAMTLTRVGRYEDARKILDEVLELEAKAKSTRLEPITEAALGELLLATHEWKDAAAHAQRSLDAYEAIGGKDNPARWWPLAVLGRAEVELGKRDDARAHLQAAAALGDKLHLNDPELAPAREALAALK
jgi:tetratricopeptide (TPR) repeat protein